MIRFGSDNVMHANMPGHVRAVVVYDRRKFGEE